MFKVYFYLVIFISLASITSKAQESQANKIKPDPILVEEDNNIKIFQVRRALALEDSQSNPKEFFINGGTDLGIKKGFVVELTRRDSFYDALRNQNIGDMLIPVGQVKIVHASRLMSIARIEKIYSSKDRPSLEYETFLVGDRLDMSTLKKKVAKKPVKKKRKVASVRKGPKVVELITISPQELILDTDEEKSVPASLRQ